MSNKPRTIRRATATDGGVYLRRARVLSPEVRQFAIRFAAVLLIVTWVVVTTLFILLQFAQEGRIGAAYVVEYA
jgi:hypothetical protein